MYVVFSCFGTDPVRFAHTHKCRIYIPCIYVLNKIDQISIEELDIITRIPHCVPISAHHRWNYDGLLEKTWDYLDLNRMYVWGAVFFQPCLCEFFCGSWPKPHVC